MMREPRLTESECRAQALSALAQKDWYGAYQAAKTWISAGGGAFQLDPWLVYAASALIHRQPKNAVHSIDLALRHWIGDAAEQAVLRWVRGIIIWQPMNDPKSALADLEVAASGVPDWLADTAKADLARCAAAAVESRKRTPSVKPAPDYVGPGTAADTVARPHVPRRHGVQPPVWNAVLTHLSVA
jgi:hypothetical protein